MAFPRIDLVNLPKSLDLEIPIDPTTRDIMMSVYLVSGVSDALSRLDGSGTVPEKWDIDATTRADYVTALQNALSAVQSAATALNTLMAGPTGG